MKIYSGSNNILIRIIVFTLGTFFLLIAGTRADDWPMLGHDPGRSGSNPNEIRPPFTRKWYRLFPDEGIQSGVQPVIANGKVYLGTLAGVMHAIDATTGKDLWTYKSSGPILHAAAACSNRVFFGSADGTVHALDTSNGNLTWKTIAGGSLWNAPVLYKNRVLIGGRNGYLYALDSDSGSIIWQSNLEAPILNSPAVDARKSRVYIGSEAMCVHALDIQTGKQLWKSEQLPGASFRGYHPVIAPDGSVMITSQPVMGYDRFQSLLMEMAKSVFGDIASWRHKIGRASCRERV